jgi:hypothetical protein
VVQYLTLDVIGAAIDAFFLHIICSAVDFIHPSHTDLMQKIGAAVSAKAALNNDPQSDAAAGAAAAAAAVAINATVAAAAAIAVDPLSSLVLQAVHVANARSLATPAPAGPSSAGRE